MASKQPRRSDLTSYLKFMAQITYATMFVWTVLALFDQMIKRDRKKEESKNPPISTGDVGFATTNSGHCFLQCRMHSIGEIADVIN